MDIYSIQIYPPQAVTVQYPMENSFTIEKNGEIILWIRLPYIRGNIYEIMDKNFEFKRFSYCNEVLDEIFSYCNQIN